MDKIIRCACCGRQIVSYRASEDHIVGGRPATMLGFGQYSCHECAMDLDENGLFPSERVQMEEMP
jgi:hypothetical protein